MDSFKEVMIEMCRLQSEVAQANARLEKRGIVPTNNRPRIRNYGEYDEELAIHNKYERLNHE
jgi:hypothetical protein|tara:strand:- start:112 stop:297 length:186 start_codon:yes stop_codon:yes gene_type:complete